MKVWICICNVEKSIFYSSVNNCEVLRDLVAFVQILKNVKNTHGGVLLLVKLQASADSRKDSRSKM